MAGGLMAKAPKDKAEHQRQKTKTAGKTARVAVSPLNGAKIPLGAHPGNTGGKPGRSGRIPSAVREACLEEFGKRIPRLASIADGMVPLTETCPACGFQAKDNGIREPEVRDIIRAMDQLGKYGLGERSEFSEDVVADNVDRMLAVAETVLSEEHFKVFARQTDAIWNTDRRG
jgi:hypothetical protein